MKYLLGAVAVSLLTACSQSPSNDEEVNNQMQYPETRKGDVVDTYFGTEVADPYRWLEDDRSEETEAWVKAQNEVTFSHLEKIPFREKIEERLTELWNYEKVSAPRFEGDYIYFYKNDGLQNQYVVYRKKSEDAEAEVFLDPNKFSEDGTTSLAQLTFSEDGSIAAYSISEGGSDWRKIIVIDAETGDQHEEPLVDVKFSGISWKGNEGFYYSSYDKPEGSELSAKTDQHKLYYHEIGTPQSEDDLIFGGTEAEKHRYVGGYVTEDDRFLVVSAANSTSGNKLYIKDLTQPDSELVLVDGNMDYDTSVLTTRGSTLYLETNMDAPNGRVVTVDASNPTPDNWQDFIAHSDHVLNPSTGAGYIFAEYMVDAVSKSSNTTTTVRKCVTSPCRE